MKKNLIVKQDGYKECGAASLLSIIRYYGGNVSINKLVSLTKTDKYGTNLYNIKLASLELGLEAIGYKVDDINKLEEIKKPFICQIVEKYYEHFIVVYRVGKNKVEVMDPAYGRKIINKEDLEKCWTSYIMIFNPIRKLQYYKDEKFLNKMIVEVIIKNKSIIFNILILSIIFTIVSFVYTFYFQTIMNVNTYNNLLVVTYVFSLLLLMKCITNFMRNKLLIYLNQKLDCTCILNTFHKVLLLPYNYYKNKTTGEIVSRINDLIYIKNILNKIILTVFLDLILFVGSGIILFRLNFKMFIILVLISLVYILIFYIFRPILKCYINKNQENSAMINSYLIESISGFETIKNLNMESSIKERMEDIYVKALGDNFIYDNVSNVEMFLKDLISLLGILLVQLLGMKFRLDNTMNLGNFITFLFLSDFFISPIKSFVDLSKEYYYAANSINRVNNLFDIEDEDLNFRTNYKIEGNIFLKDLKFSYNGNKDVLSDISLVIPAKSKIMILGSSGSGKSTIFKLLLKYYQVRRDNVYIDGIDINDYSISNIRENIALVSQNEFIYTDTIRNNITMNQNVDDNEFIEVCNLVCLDEFVNKLFLGYDTKLEENGVNLSGGQRQRIILARMLLENKKIMLIDEGLNAIDINLERKILRNIFDRYSENTILIVSHRLKNLDLFDSVIRLNNGNSVEVINNEEELLI